MAKIRLTVKNLDGSARRVFDTSKDLVRRLEYLAAVEGWDEVVIPYAGRRSLQNSDLSSVASRIRFAANHPPKKKKKSRAKPKLKCEAETPLCSGELVKVYSVNGSSTEGHVFRICVTCAVYFRQGGSKLKEVSRG